MHAVPPWPGIICLILGALLLSWWERRRLSTTPSAATPRWLLPTAGLAVNVIAFGLIADRFIAIHLHLCGLSLDQK
jgi:hypothetical protein